MHLQKIVLAGFFFLILIISCRGKLENKNITSSYYPIVSDKTVVPIRTNYSIDNCTTVKIDLDEYDRKILTSEIIDNVRFVKLKNNRSALIGSISKIEICDSIFFIGDYNFSKGVHAFDKRGEPLFSILASGQGPREFIELNCFAIDHLKKQIIISDSMLGKLLFFDFKGSFIEAKRLPFRFSDLIQLNDSLFVFHTYRRYNNQWPAIQNYSILIGGLTGKEFYSGIPYHEQQRDVSSSGSNQFQNMLKDISYQYPLNDTIFSISSNTILAKYVIDLDEKTLPSGFDYNIDIRQFDNRFMNPSSKYGFIYPVGFFESPSSLHFKIFYKGKIVFVFYSKQTQKVLYGKNIFNDRMDFLTIGQYIGKYNDEAIFYINGFDLMKHRSYYKNNQLDSKTSALLESANENDNPVLFFYKFKNF